MSFTATELHTDPTGFPMIWISEIRAFIHWLPVTKIQFEYFLCDAPDRHFDATWYDKILDMNPRRSPHELVSTNYWNAFISGLLPLEAQRFAYWAGSGYRLPTAEQWAHAYSVLQQKPVRTLGPLVDVCGTERARELLTRVEVAASIPLSRSRQHRTLADQLLLRGGILEWTELTDSDLCWGLQGEPFPSFCGTLNMTTAPGVTVPLDPHNRRFASVGFRLLYFPEPPEDGRHWGVNEPKDTQGED